MFCINELYCVLGAQTPNSLLEKPNLCRDLLVHKIKKGFYVTLVVLGLGLIGFIVHGVK